MKKLVLFFSLFISTYSINVNAWEANVTNILQHGGWLAVTLSPDPGKGSCDAGSPYLLPVDGTPENNQRFSMILTALTSGKKLAGYPETCESAIWGISRPTIRRLNIRAN